jgi:hypothetical protein
MSDQEDAKSAERLMLAGSLGLAMAQEAVEIFLRHLDRSQLTKVKPDGMVDIELNVPAPDGAVFCTILEAAQACLGGFDGRPLDDRQSDAFVQLVDLARLSSRVP